MKSAFEKFMGKGKWGDDAHLRDLLRSYATEETTNNAA
jgi:hypothetical protein